MARDREMSYDRIGNTRIRDHGKKKSIFDKVNEIKNDVKLILPEVEGEKLIAMLSKIRTYLAHKKKGVPLGRRGWKGFRDLTANERILYEYLLKHDLNASTTYRWFIATRLPSDVQEKLSKNQISMRKAMELSANRRRMAMSNQGLLVMEELRNLMRAL
ncbi:MAG TPA: hypothetical protein VK158_01250 [Acidobacteriota bacterium]|nr:hypothetical protein [Acidobacteriota bacterium]